jgi:hypothetical protein
MAGDSLALMSSEFRVNTLSSSRLSADKDTPTKHNKDTLTKHNDLQCNMSLSDELSLYAYLDG